MTTCSKRKCTRETTDGYKQCSVCRKAAAEYMRDYAKRRAEDNDPLPRYTLAPFLRDPSLLPKKPPGGRP